MKLHPCLAIAALLLSGASATAQTLPAYMAPISGKSAATAADSSGAIRIFMFGGSALWGTGARDEFTIRPGSLAMPVVPGDRLGPVGRAQLPQDVFDM